MEPALSFGTREDWRNWLEKNHAKETYVWLAFHRKGSGNKGLTLEESVEEAICFGWIDGKLQKVDATSYIVRFSPRKTKSVWSKINKERAERLIDSGRMTNEGLAVINAAKKNFIWDNAYTNKVRDEVPADLKKALMKEEKTWMNFQEFANTYRNMYIGWVTSSGTHHTRMARIAKVVEQTTKNKKLISE